MALHKTRFLILAFAVALVIWLLLDQLGQAGKREARVEVALASGELGVLTDTEREFFKRTFQQWALAAGIMDPIWFDEPFERGGLHVFSTSPAALKVTGNQAGNGLYDRDLDAIFLDQNLFHVPNVVFLYGNIDVNRRPLRKPVLDGYLLFVFLHELGHRQLHRSWWVRAGPDREREADDFVLKVLQGPGSTLLRKSPPAYSTPFFAWGQRDPAEEPFIALAGSIVHTTYVLMHSDSPYSPFRRGVVHPTFIQRAVGLIESASPLVRGSAAINFINLVEDSLSRMARTSKHPMVELRTPFPISIAGFSAGDLVIFENEKGMVGTEHRVPLSRLTGKSCGQPVCTVDWSPTKSRRRNGSIPARFARVLPSQDSSLDVATELGIFRAEQSRWTALPGKESPPVLSAGEYRVAGTDDIIPKSWRIMRGVQVLGEVKLSELVAAVQGIAKDQIGLKPIAVRRKRILFLAEDGLKIRGVVETNLVGNVVKYLKLRVDHEDFRAGPVWPGQISVCATDRNDEIVVVVSTRTHKNIKTHSRPYEIEVWRLSPSVPPVKLSSHRMWVDALSGPDNLRNIQWVSVPIISVEASPGRGGLLIDVYLGSTYYFDCAEQSLKMIFHPGGLEQTMSGSGEVAYFARRGNKIFVMTLPGATNRR